MEISYSPSTTTFKKLAEKKERRKEKGEHQPHDLAGLISLLFRLPKERDKTLREREEKEKKRGGGGEEERNRVPWHPSSTIFAPSLRKSRRGKKRGEGEKKKGKEQGNYSSFRWNISSFPPSSLARERFKGKGGEKGGGEKGGKKKRALEISFLFVKT